MSQAENMAEENRLVDVEGVLFFVSYELGERRREGWKRVG